MREATDADRPRRRHPRRPAGPQDPARRGSPTARSSSCRARVHDHHPRRPGRREGVSARRTPACPGDVTAGDRILIDDGKLAPRSPRRGHRDRRRVPGARGRHVSQQQGHQPARRRGVRARDVGEGHGRPALGAAPARRLHRAVVRAHRRRHPTTCTQIMDEEGAAPARHRQDREAAGHRQPRRDHRAPSTASWWRAATSAWSARSRTCRSCRSGSSRSPAATPSRSSSPPRCSSR